MRQSEKEIQQNKDWNPHLGHFISGQTPSEKEIQQNKDWNQRYREYLQKRAVDVRKGNPTEQGLKLFSLVHWHLNFQVRKGNPTEQGLKPEVARVRAELWSVRKGNPTEQGLKHGNFVFYWFEVFSGPKRKSNRTRIETPVVIDLENSVAPSEKEIQQNKDWNCIVYQLIRHNALGPKRKSNRTRIETDVLNVVLKGYRVSEKEIQQNKDWNTIYHCRFNLNHCRVRKGNPTEQGLKLHYRANTVSCDKGPKRKSNRNLVLRTIRHRFNVHISLFRYILFTKTTPIAPPTLKHLLEKKLTRSR